MYIEFNVSDARKNTADAIACIIGENLALYAQLIDMIKSSSSKGDNSLTRYISYPKPVIEKLKSNGFSVDIKNCQRDGTTTHISWE